MQPVAIVTGASAGLGKAIAQELAMQGYSLVLGARSTDALLALAGALTRAGGSALPVPTDVTNPDDLQRLLRLTLEQFGRIDVLVNNAGISETRRTAPESNSIADLTMHTNLLAPIQLARMVAPIMVEQRSGHIINITSVASHIAMPGSSSYAASKHGLHGFSEALRRELRPVGVHVSMISPGFIRTNMTRSVRIPMPGPELIAHAVTQVLQHPQAEMVVPGYYRPPIWINNHFPWLLDLLLGNRLTRLIRRQNKAHGDKERAL